MTIIRRTYSTLFLCCLLAITGCSGEGVSLGSSRTDAETTTSTASSNVDQSSSGNGSAEAGESGTDSEAETTDNNVTDTGTVTETESISYGPYQDAIDFASSDSTWQLDDVVETDEEAADFLIQATFGPTVESIAELRSLGYSAWYRQQLAYEVDEYLDEAQAGEAEYGSNSKAERFTMNSWFSRAVTGDDQLRQVATFALSQLIPTSTLTASRKSQLQALFKEILQTNAFGNYRDILQEITYNPLMGEWLTFAGNEKADPDTGAAPDENYAREIMQLFTIGLVELEQNGREKLQNGESIETYDNTDVTELAKVFTGLYWANTSFNGRINSSSTAETDLFPMEMHNEYHSEGTKTFLGSTVAQYDDGNQTISDALDILFEHDNVAPFVSNILIQRLVTSNPGAGYVERVSEAFNTGLYTLPDGTSVGTGERGDLSAVFAAILFDLGARGDFRTEDSDAGNASGKVRDPITRLVHWMRVAEIEGFEAPHAYVFSDLGALPFRAASVFNFYRPGFVASNAATGDEDLVAPELQIFVGPNIIEFLNQMNALIPRTTANADYYLPQYTSMLEVADDSTALADRLNLVYTAGRMSDATLQDLKDVIESVVVTGTEDEQNTAKLNRIYVGTFLSVSSVEFTIGR